MISDVKVKCLAENVNARASTLESGFSIGIGTEYRPKRIHCDKCLNEKFFFEPTWNDEHAYLICTKCGVKYKVAWGLVVSE